MQGDKIQNLEPKIQSKEMYDTEKKIFAKIDNTASRRTSVKQIFLLILLFVLLNLPYSSRLLCKISESEITHIVIKVTVFAILSFIILK